MKRLTLIAVRGLWQVPRALLLIALGAAILAGMFALAALERAKELWARMIPR